MFKIVKIIKIGNPLVDKRERPYILLEMQFSSRYGDASQTSKRNNYDHSKQITKLQSILFVYIILFIFPKKWLVTVE